VTFSISPDVYGVWNADLRPDGLYNLPVWQYQDGEIPAHSSYVEFGYTISGPSPATITLSSGLCAPYYPGCTVQIINQFVNSWTDASGETYAQYTLVVNNIGSRIAAHVNLKIVLPNDGTLSSYWNLILDTDDFECELWNLYPSQSSQACGYIATYSSPPPTFNVVDVDPLCI